MRFVTVGAERLLCVSKMDLVDVAASVADADSQNLFHQLFEKGIRDILYSGDVRSGVLGSAAIGPVLHYVSAGSLIHLWATLPQQSPFPLLDYSRRMNTVFEWYLANIQIASRQLGVTWTENFNAALERLDRVNPPLDVNVIFSDGFYTAECDALHLVAEAATLDELEQVTWALVPELIELNALPLEPEQIRLRFSIVQSGPQRLVL